MDAARVAAADGAVFVLAGSLSPGVALCRAHADGARENGIELMLKGGQMGGEDLFDRLVNGA